jgi:dipeptidyl-peptidase 4
MHPSHLLIAGMILVSSSTSFAEAPKTKTPLTLATIFTERAFDEERMDAVIWSQLNASYFTLEKATASKTGKDLVRHDAATGERTIVVPAGMMKPSAASAPLTIASFQFSADEAKLLLFTNTKKVWRKHTRGDYWVLDLKTKLLTQLGGDAAPSTLMYAKFSPDGTRVAYMRKNNLYVQDLTDWKITPLTTDGSDTLINGGSDWVNEEELSLRDGFRWSPDGKRIAFWQFDTSGVKKFWLVNQTDGNYQSFTTFPYPKAGEKNSAVRLGVISSEGGSVTWMAMEGDPRGHYIPFAEWQPSGEALWIQQFNRLQNTLHLFSADPATGRVTTLLTDKDEAWVENKNLEPRWVGDSLLWLSERSGWRHAYLISEQGAAQPLTEGAFDVIEITAVQPEAGTFDFIASPENATQRYLYRGRLDRAQWKRVSPAERAGTHSYQVSKDGAWAIHTYSTATTPPTVSVVTLPDHQVVRTLKSNQALKDKLATRQAPKVEFIQVDIGGGIMADAWMIRSADLNDVQTHPLLMHVYSEPASQTVRDVWGGQRGLWHWMLAEKGIVIASVDSRGTPAPKGRAWRKAIYRQVGTLNVTEQAHATNELLQRYRFLDRKRVGVWGWSGGGSTSLHGLFRHPALYRTAIAVAPVADRRLYDSIYEERYMGLPSENEVGYREGSPITHVKGLQGPLLLIHGTGDDNVHYQGTEKLMNELITLNKPFTVMPYPNRDHSINTGKGISRHLYELMTHWLERELVGTLPR